MAAHTRLTRVQIESYRSCKQTELSLDPEMTALIGINGAGKTNILSAIKLIGSQLPRSGFNRKTEEPTTPETIITSWFDVNGKKIGHRIKLQLSISNRNTDEIVSMLEEWNFQSITNSRAWKSVPHIFLMQRDLARKFQDTKSSHEYDLAARQMERYEYDLYRRSRLNLPIKVDESILSNSEALDSAFEVEKFRNGITYYSASQFTDSTKCPSSFETESDSSLVKSYGISTVHLKFLHDLYLLKKNNPDLYSTYEELISKNELGLISKLSWKEVRLSSNLAEVKSGGEVRKVRKYKTLVIPKVQIGLSHITFNQLSEGTFKTLALLFYLMTDESSCIIIEEPEVCVHMGLLNRVISTAKAYSSDKQVIISTHSDQVLDRLDPENIAVVEMTSLGTVATSLNNWLGPKGRQALTNYLGESGTLGEYWRSGGLSR